jgi:hypothetical protein
MEGRHERRALAAGGDVAAAEIGDHVDARQLRQQRGVVGLAREAEFGPVADGLAVYCDGAHGAGRVCQQGAHALGVARRQAVGCQRLAFQFVVAFRLQRHQLGAQRGREGGKGGAQRANAAPGEVGEHAVHAVQAGAGHQTDVEGGSGHRRILSKNVK